MASVKEIREHQIMLRREITEEGERLRGQELPELTPELFALYETTGNRLIYENRYFERRKQLTVFGLLALWHGREKDLRELERILEGICGEETWALPAHVDRSEERWRVTVDLFACETGQTLAQLVTQLSGKLDDGLCQRVRLLVKERLLDSFLSVPQGQWRWESFRNNWVAVCAGCLGCMALDLLPETDEQRALILERVERLMPEYLAGMKEDGTCPEGLGYFTYGMVYYTGFYWKWKGDAFLREKKVQNIARFQQLCYLPGGVTVSFADGSLHDRYRLGLTCLLAGHVEGVTVPDIHSAMHFGDDHCYRFLGNYQDDVWVTDYLSRQSGSLQTQAVYGRYLLPDAQWAVWQEKDAAAACKGGHNGESHNHNDVGSFQYIYRGECYLTDLGCGEYTGEYFREDSRYKILCNRSLGHSVPLVCGQEQCAGTQYGASAFWELGANGIALEYAGAYPLGCAERLIREVELSKHSKTLRIRDHVWGLAEADGLMENLVTQMEPEVRQDGICLKGERGTVCIRILEKSGGFEVKETVFHNHRGKEEKVWLLQWQVPGKDGEAACTICIGPETDTGEQQ